MQHHYVLPGTREKSTKYITRNEGMRAGSLRLRARCDFGICFVCTLLLSPVVGENVGEEDEDTAVGAAVASAGACDGTRIASSVGCWVGDANAPSGATGERAVGAKLGHWSIVVLQCMGREALACWSRAGGQPTVYSTFHQSS